MGAWTSLLMSCIKKERTERSLRIGIVRAKVYRVRILNSHPLLRKVGRPRGTRETLLHGLVRNPLTPLLTCGAGDGLVAGDLMDCPLKPIALSVDALQSIIRN